MVFYFSLSGFPFGAHETANYIQMTISDEQRAEIYELLASAGNARNDGNMYSSMFDELCVTKAKEFDNNASLQALFTSALSNTKTYSIDTVELVSTPSGDRIKVTLSA